MKRIKLLLTAAVALPAMAACGGQSGNTTADGDANGVAAADQNQAAALSDPFMAAHQRMQSAMANAQGANASETFVRKMIEHHRGGIAMSDALIAQGGDPNALEKARAAAQDQRREQQELERMLQGGISGGTGPANPFAEAEARMNERMMAIHGASPSAAWTRMMIEHHRGAVEMANIIIRQGGNAEVVALARRIVEKQTREIAELESLLTGEHQAADVAKAEAADQQPAAAPPRKASERPAQRPAPQPKAPSADPHAGHDMGNMANMSH